MLWPRGVDLHGRLSNGYAYSLRSSSIKWKYISMEFCLAMNYLVCVDAETLVQSDLGKVEN